MDFSAFANAIAAEEAWLDSLAPWLIGASVAVIIGLAIEQWPDLWKLHWEHWDNDKFLEILGGSVVAIFILAELIVTFLASRSETRLRLDNSLYEAALADETAKANERAATLEKEAARLSADNLDLERIMTPRRFLGASGPYLRGGPSLSKLLAWSRDLSKMQTFAGTVVLIQTVPDFEAQTLANDLVDGLRKARWAPSIISEKETGVEPFLVPEGILIWSGGAKTNDHLWSAAASLVAVLRDENMAVNWDWSGTTSDTEFARRLAARMPSGQIVALIGMRPALIQLWRKEDEATRSTVLPKK